jgi:adenylate cyclase
MDGAMRHRVMRAIARRYARVTSRTAIHRLRLVTGLTLFAYVFTHLVNHALGNVSLGAMQDGLIVQKWIWQGAIGTTALYGALITHFLLGLRALYDRRDYGWRASEAVQLVLGFLIPFLLMNHIFVTRIALVQFDVTKGYPQELYTFWVKSPRLGVQQVAVLIVAWAHACFGIYFWLRIKPFFSRLAPALTCGAVLLPVLALLGFYQGGRRVLSLAHDPAFRAANLAASKVGTAAQDAILRGERNAMIILVAGLIVATLLLRLWRGLAEMRGGSIRITYPEGRSVRVPIGFSVLQASLAARVPHASLCGGRARCSTCRIRVIAGSGRIPSPSAGEQAVLDRVGAGPLVRLACQLRPEGDIKVVPLLPPHYSFEALRRHAWSQSGEERFVVVLVADLRDSMRLAETRLPFDTVFIIDRFVNAVSVAVTAAGGRPNQFTGDGLMAVFGLDCAPAEACRCAILAVGLIGRKVAELNQVLAAEMGQPVRFGVGVHGSSAVVGEVGLAETRVFTTLGDAANGASRIEKLCKDYGCEAVISDGVCRESGLPLDRLPCHEVSLRGREAGLAVRIIDRTERLASLLAIGSTSRSHHPAS